MDPISFNEDLNLQRNHFQEALKKHGDTINAVNWGSEESQQARFEALLGGIPWQNTYSILDVGCGRGDLYAFAVAMIDNVKYMGVDICPEMVALAQQRYPGIDFRAMNIMNENPGNFDYVLSAGIFSLKSPNWNLYVVEMMKRMHELSKVFCAATFLSNLTPFEQHENSYHADPGGLLDLLAIHVSANISLLHNYRKNDFTVKIYR